MYVIHSREVNYETAPESVKEQLIQNQILMFCPYDDYAVIRWFNTKLYPWLDENVTEGFYSYKFTAHTNDDIYRRFDKVNGHVYGCTIIVSFTSPVEAEHFKQQCMKWKLEKS